MSSFVDVFVKQRELFTQFFAIEHPGKPIPALPFSFEKPNVEQQNEVRLKTLFFIEELIEAEDESRKAKKLEEYADALHFLAEIGLMIGFSPASLDLISKNYIITTPSPLSAAGRFVHRLKAKPWKKNPAETLGFEVQEGYRDVAHEFFALVRVRYTINELIRAYFAKHVINQKRIDENA